MTSEIIKWDANRFVMREYLDTGAVYIFDKVENVVYFNQTATTLLTELPQSNLSRYSKKTPKDLEVLLDKPFRIFTIEAPHNGKPFICFDHSTFASLLLYAVTKASGSEKREKALSLCFKVQQAGSYAFGLHLAGIQLKPVFEEDLLIETIDVHDRVTLKLEATKTRKNYCEVMNQAFMNSLFHW